MKMVFRWYGPGDSIPLTYIRQIPGMTGVVTAVYDVPVGEVWQTERILALRDACRAAGLEMEVIESVPVHEDIKLGRPSRDRYIENYAATIENLGRAGVRCICYNFMPVFDWLRTNLHTPLADGSNALSYCHEELMGLDPHCLHLPGWDESYTQSQLDTLLGAYAGMSHGELFDNLVYFLRGRQYGNPSGRSAVGYVRIAAHHNRSGQLRTVVRRRSRHPQRHHALHRIAGRRPW